MSTWKENLKTILITDDHSVIRKTLCDWLIEEIPDIEIIEASSGERALSILGSESEPDLIVMDFHLPGISGLEATREIKSSAPDVPVVMLTIQEDRQYVSRALEAGVDGYVIKRKMYTDLLPTIQEILS